LEYPALLVSDPNVELLLQAEEKKQDDTLDKIEKVIGIVEAILKIIDPVLGAKTIYDLLENSSTTLETLSVANNSNLSNLITSVANNTSTLQQTLEQSTLAQDIVNGLKGYLITNTSVLDNIFGQQQIDSNHFTPDIRNMAEYTQALSDAIAPNQALMQKMVDAVNATAADIKATATNTEHMLSEIGSIAATMTQVVGFQQTMVGHLNNIDTSTAAAIPILNNVKLELADLAEIETAIETINDNISTISENNLQALTTLQNELQIVAHDNLQNTNDIISSQATLHHDLQTLDTDLRTLTTKTLSPEDLDSINTFCVRLNDACVNNIRADVGVTPDAWLQVKTV
jgi:cell division septum initiation protein DivIVA